MLPDNLQKQGAKPSLAPAHAGASQTETAEPDAATGCYRPARTQRRGAADPSKCDISELLGLREISTPPPLPPRAQRPSHTAGLAPGILNNARAGGADGAVGGSGGGARAGGGALAAQGCALSHSARAMVVAWRTKVTN